MSIGQSGGCYYVGGTEGTISVCFPKGWQDKNLSMARQIVIILLSIGVISAAGGLSGCSGSRTRDSEKGKRMPARTIEEVLKDKTDEWMVIPGVEGTGIGMSEGSHCIKILSSVNAQELRTKIPSSVEGYSVIIEETGKFRALDKE
jgi:hypothetical protein